MRTVRAHVSAKFARSCFFMPRAFATGSVRSYALISLVSVAFLLGCATSFDEEARPSDGFTNFEAAPVHPIVLNSDGSHLFALNTADDRLEIFEASDGGLRSVGETMVGLRPVAITLRNDNEAWVANHLSDSVNIVDVGDPSRPRVVRTLQVGDEPRGIVAAGPDRRWVLVATAYRGQSLKPGLGRARISIFDGEHPELPPKSIDLFGTKPRALAVSADGKRVFAGIFHSGNGTAAVGSARAAAMGRVPVYDKENLPPVDGRPSQGAIVRRMAKRWRDFDGQDWSDAIAFDLPDYDVFVIDVSTDDFSVTDKISGVGTVLFDIVVTPGRGEIWVSNTEARNFTPREGRLRSSFASNRITRLIHGDGKWKIHPVELNRHVDTRSTSGSEKERALSVAQPMGIAFDSSRDMAYVAGFASGKVAVLGRDTQVIDRIDVGFGPAGLAFDPRRRRLYVYNHLDATISVVETDHRRVVSTVALRHNPVTDVIKSGRPLLFDARAFSAHGTLSCATCHVFADLDGLAWDLGKPDGPIVEIPKNLINEVIPVTQAFHPLKGPMMTQSLRGLRDTAPFHWRGDRFGRNAAVPGGDLESFKDFNKVYVDLMGLDEVPSDTQMDAFAKYALTIQYPPNPNEAIDRKLSPTRESGRTFFTSQFPVDRGAISCVECHSPPSGTNRRMNFEGFQLSRDLKTPHLRNIYQKVGRFEESGPQISGFGMTHDGSMGTVVDFLRLNVFEFPDETMAKNDVFRRNLNDFVMAFPTGMAPAVGRQVTIRPNDGAGPKDSVSILMERTTLGDCDLVARARIDGEKRGWLFRDSIFTGDRSADSTLRFKALLKRYGNAPVTFLCVPPGDGVRSALDRDSDGHRDGDERRFGSDPTDSGSVPVPELAKRSRDGT